MGIIGGVKEFDGIDSSHNIGVNLIRACIILLLVVFLALSLTTLVTLLAISAIAKGERDILYALTCSIPFIFLRLIYSMLVNFDGSDPKFAISTSDVVTEACTASLGEFVTIILYLGAGLLAPKIPKSNLQPVERKGTGVDLELRAESGQPSKYFGCCTRNRISYIIQWNMRSRITCLRAQKE